MTDITPLTQSEINDALAQLKQLSEYPTPSTQYARVLRKYFASLVEALEKAQARIAELSVGKVGNALLERENHHVEVVGKLTDRIAELEDAEQNLRPAITGKFNGPKYWPETQT
ncbi:hypothetical protein [Klebsiella pneumoniae]|uniref:hypothetical protein n=1 Tax=Klebsiella pneumoniae TaxID=573 RepID=UPI001BD1DF91|nr:hypothetical protein [Klebsiella pneumoniae]MBS9797434.1 hypothetical protein [Klebsiella pneumoniae]